MVRQLVDLTYDAVRTRAATVSGFVLLFLVGTYSYFYLLKITTSSSWLAFLLLLGYMAGLVILAMPTFSLNTTHILRAVGERPPRTRLWRWILFLMFTGGVVSLGFFSVRDAFDKNAESLSRVTQSTILVATLLAALVYLGAMIGTAFTRTDNTFSHLRAEAYASHVRYLCGGYRSGAKGNSKNTNIKGSARGESDRDKSKDGDDHDASASPASGQRGRGLAGCWCGAELTGRATDAVNHLTSLHAYPDGLFLLHPLCVLLEGDMTSAGGSGGEDGVGNNNNSNSDRNPGPPEVVVVPGGNGGRGGRMLPSLPALATLGGGNRGGNSAGAGEETEDEEEEYEDVDVAPPPMCGSLRGLARRAREKVSPPPGKGGRVFFYPSLLMTTFCITVILLVLAAGIGAKFANDSEESLKGVTAEFDENVSRLRAARGFLALLLKLQPELAALFDAEDLLASLDTAVDLLSRTGDLVSSFLTALRRVAPAALTIGLIVAILTSVLMLVKYRETTFAVRSGALRRTAGFKESAFPASKVTVFAGVAFSTALLGFAWCSMVSALVLLVFVWDEPREYLFAEERYSFVIGIVALVVIKTIINKVVINKMVTDSFSVRHPVMWGFVGFILMLVNFVTGVASAIVRFVVTVALSFVYLLRLDTSVFPSSLRGSDAGYSAFISVALMVERHGNPVALEAARFLLTEGKQGAARRKAAAMAGGADPVGGTSEPAERLPGLDTSINDAEATPSVDKARTVAANRWALAYTLMRNPEMRRFRMARRPVRKGDAGEDAAKEEGGSHWFM